MRHPLFPALLAVAFLSASCDLVVTKSPVADATDEILREELAGTWHHEGKALELHFDEKGVGQLGSLQWTDGKFEVETAAVIAAEIDGEGYLSVRSLEEQDEMKEWMFAAFDREEDGAIRILTLDTRAVAKLVEEGKLKGEVKKGRYSTSVLIDDVRALIEATRPIEDFYKADEDSEPMRRL